MSVFCDLVIVKTENFGTISLHLYRSFALNSRLQVVCLFVEKGVFYGLLEISNHVICIGNIIPLYFLVDSDVPILRFNDFTFSLNAMFGCLYHLLLTVYGRIEICEKRSSTLIPDGIVSYVEEQKGRGNTTSLADFSILLYHKLSGNL